MAFKESERVQIRKWVGFAAIFQQADPRLENAISAVQSIADGGTRPNPPSGSGLTVSESEELIRCTLAELVKVETRIEKIRNFTFASEVDEVKVDPARGLLILYMEGRRLVGTICDVLSTRPRRDVFSAPGEQGEGPYPFFVGRQPQW